MYIIGASFTVKIICTEFFHELLLERVVAFLDDDQEKIGSFIDSIPILGPIDAVGRLQTTGMHGVAIIAISTIPQHHLRIVNDSLLAEGFMDIRILSNLS